MYDWEDTFKPGDLANYYHVLLEVPRPGSACMGQYEVISVFRPVDLGHYMAEVKCTRCGVKGMVAVSTLNRSDYIFWDWLGCATGAKPVTPEDKAILPELTACEANPNVTGYIMSLIERTMRRAYRAGVKEVLRRDANLSNR